MNSASGSGAYPGSLRARRAHPRSGAGAASRRRGRPCRGCPRSCRGCVSAASRRWRAAAASAGIAEATSAPHASVYVSAAPSTSSPSLVAPASQLRHAPEVEQGIGPLALGVERHHEVGAAGDRSRFRVPGAQPERFLERARYVHVHVYTLVGQPVLGRTSAPAARRPRGRRSPRCGRAAACAQSGREGCGPRRGCADGGTRVAGGQHRGRSGIEQEQIGARAGLDAAAGSPRRSAGATEQRNAMSLLVRPSASSTRAVVWQPEMPPHAANASPSLSSAARASGPRR